MAKIKTGALDTNVLVRLIVNDVPSQTICVDRLFAEGDKFDIADITLFEMIFVLERIYNFSRTDVVESILTIIRHPKINCNRKLFERSSVIYTKFSKLSFVDCSLIEYSKLNNSGPLYTFDQALAKANPDDTCLLIAHD